MKKHSQIHASRNNRTDPTGAPRSRHVFAPSAGNERPWHYIVVEERTQFEEIMKVHPYSRMLKEAPLAIVVCADLTTDKNYWVQDCAAATENILIAAQEKGLGACWLGIIL